jgi:hypothetical protein
VPRCAAVESTAGLSLLIIALFSQSTLGRRRILARASIAIILVSEFTEIARIVTRDGAPSRVT